MSRARADAQAVARQRFGAWYTRALPSRSRKVNRAERVLERWHRKAVGDRLDPDDGAQS